MKTFIEDNDKYSLIHHTGNTIFRGCQCYSDCSCNEDFVSHPYNYYTVKKKFNKPKTTIHNTIEEAEKRITFLLTLPINY